MACDRDSPERGPTRRASPRRSDGRSAAQADGPFRAFRSLSHPLAMKGRRPPAWRGFVQSATAESRNRQPLWGAGEAQGAVQTPFRSRALRAIAAPRRHRNCWRERQERPVRASRQQRRVRPGAQVARWDDGKHPKAAAARRATRLGPEPAGWPAVQLAGPQVERSGVRDLTARWAAVHEGGQQARTWSADPRDLVRRSRSTGGPAAHPRMSPRVA